MVSILSCRQITAGMGHTGHNWKTCEHALPEDEEGEESGTKDEWHKHLDRGPRVCHTTPVEADKDENRRDDGED